MKYRSRNRPHLRKAKQKELDRIDRLHESVEKEFPNLPHITAEDELEQSLEDMLDIGEGNLPDR